MSGIGGEASAIASSAIQRAIEELLSEVVLTRSDAKRCDARGNRVLGSDLRARANRLQDLAETLKRTLEMRQGKNGRGSKGLAASVRDEG